MTRIVLFVLLAIISVTTINAHEAGLAGETVYPRHLRSAAEPDYPPLSFESSAGNADGLAVELLQATTQAMGQHLHLEVRPWGTIKQELASGQLDVLPLMARTPEREKQFDFTVPYLTLHGAIVVRKDDRSTFTLNELQGRKIGVMRGDVADEYMQREGFTPWLVATESYADALQQLDQGKLDAVVIQQLVALQLIDELALANIEIRSELSDFRQDWCFAVTEGDETLLASLNEGLSKVIADGTYQQLRSKWLGHLDPKNYIYPQRQFELELTSDEKEWIAENPEVSFTAPPNWLPFGHYQQDGSYIGVIADHLKLVGKKTGLKFSPVAAGSWKEMHRLAEEGKVSAVSSVSSDLRLSQHYRPVEISNQNPIVIVMSSQQHYVEHLEDIEGKKIAVVRDHPYSADILSHYQQIDFVMVDSIEQGLKRVAAGQIDAMLATMAQASYSINAMGLYNIKVVGKTAIVAELTLFVDHAQPTLYAIINKTLKYIHQGESQRIMLSWGKAEYVERTDYRTMILMAVGMLIVVVVVLLWNRSLQREIAVRRKAEESLQFSEKTLAESQKIVHLGSWAHDLVSNKLTWSDEVYRIFELDPAVCAPSYELLMDTIHPDDRKLVNDIYTDSVAGGKPYDIEHRLLMKDGRIKYVNERCETSHDENGTPLRSVGTVLDVSEQKRTENYIRVANERFNLVMQASNDGVWDWDVATDTVYYSPRWKSMLGYQEHELENKFSTWEALVDSDDRQQMMKLIEECFSGTREGFDVEFRMRHKDGRWIDVLSRSISVRNSDGEVVRFVGTHVDLSEYKKLEGSLREQEKELITIIDQLPSILFLKEAKDLRYVRFNHSGEKKLGLPPGYFIGKTDYDIFPSEIAEVFRRDDWRALNSSEEIDISEEIIDTPVGKRTMHTRKVTITDENGEPKYLLGISDDITEQREAEKEYQRLQRELQQAQKMESLGQLTGGIAHDFNNLLGIINGYSGLALASCQARGEDKLAEYMRHLQEAGDRATNLVSQMLAFSRSDMADDLPVQFAPLLKADIKMLRSTLPTTIEMNTEIEPGLPSVVMNPTQLHQILMNLSINGRDAMQGVGKLNIKLGWVRDLDTVSPISHKPVKGDWIELSVSDTGSGIDTETAKSIFNPFFTTKEVGKGTGMGLSVIYGIMENHDGHILLESELGKGSVFRMLFPPHLVGGDTIQSGIDKQLEIPDGDGSEILVVDDELSLGIFMAELLNSHGYKAISAGDGIEALELFEQQPERFKMVITDQTMPKMTGIEMIAKVREIRPDLPAILCTGYSDKIDAKGAAEQGIEFFEKPVDGSKLFVKIAELLHSRRA